MADPSADVTVVGLVHDSHIIEDIGVIVPKGTAVTIPGHLTIRSKDLYRALSQHYIMQLYRLPPSNQGAQAAGLLSKAEAARLQDEVARLTEQNNAHVARIKVLEAELASVHAELAKKNAEGAKLDDILAVLKERPQVINQVIQAAPSSSTLPASPQEKVSGDAPLFIPSQIRTDTTDERVAVEETVTASTGVSEAANKLSALRGKKKQ